MYQKKLLYLRRFLRFFCLNRLKKHTQVINNHQNTQFSTSLFKDVNGTSAEQNHEKTYLSRTSTRVQGAGTNPSCLVGLFGDIVPLSSCIFVFIDDGARA